MGNKGFLKRALPFLATFAISVFILSVVFGIRPGPFRGHRHHRGQLRHENDGLKAENEALRNENLRLMNEMESHLEPHRHGFGDGAGTLLPDPPLPLKAKSK